MTDNSKLHHTHDMLTMFSFCDCGCIKRGDSVNLRYCRFHNPKQGTHNRG